ncbi:translation elongation factor-like protein [Chloroflexota bacterium]
MTEQLIGTVSDFFAKPVVAGIELTGDLYEGDIIHIVGHTTDLEMVAKSMQINNQAVTEAHRGEAVGLEVTDRVRHGDKVYKIEK